MQPPNNVPVCEIPVYVTSKNGKPCIELRSTTIELELIKKIVYATYHGIPIIVKPVSRNNVKFMASLVSYGILFYDKEKEQYFYTW